jgi:hypothetical protein
MPTGAPTTRLKASRRWRHPRTLAAPPTESTQFPWTAPPNPRRGGKAARLESGAKSAKRVPGTLPPPWLTGPSCSSVRRLEGGSCCYRTPRRCAPPSRPPPQDSRGWRRHWFVCLRHSYHRLISPSFKASGPQQKQTCPASTSIRPGNLTIARHRWHEGGLHDVRAADIKGNVYATRGFRCFSPQSGVQRSSLLLGTSRPAVDTAQRAARHNARWSTR